ncbi:MAG TPA: RagB/SusD family nutrient uptake outer membrane protein [Puia sp.]|nr:RagB/SusD family nutrient uptake outer membrane protein [Puia sp.]
MNTSKYIKLSALLLLAGMAGCTKLKENYTTTVPGNAVTEGLGDQGPTLLLSSAYNDIPAPFVNQDRVFSLEECTTDEALVPTRGGDWDDNGVWRVMHNHTWNADHDQLLQTFNLLNKMNFDATNVLTLKPTTGQIAEAKFLRCLSLYYLLDLFGQFPLRQPGDNLLLPPPVYSGDSAINYIINELESILPDLSGSDPTKANPYACKTLLMRCYLNKGAFLNRKTPSFADADMQKVISLGQSIIDSNKYSYESNYFNNFSAVNGGSHELIFGYPSSSGLTVNNPGLNARWMMTFHYNEYNGQAPNAGWNGFSTIGDFYSTFSLTGTVAFSRADTPLDTRLGGRYNSYPQTTAASGIRPGFLVGQQYDQDGNKLQDRKQHDLSFDPTIANDMIEQGSNLEVTGIRVAKYVPDFSDAGGKYYSSNSGNWLALFRYPDVTLMIAEAKLRAGTPDNAGALTLVNDLRAARGAAPMAGPLVLNNAGNTKDPNTLLAERGRELYWEGIRRTDLIRFGVFLVPWQYKPSDDPKYLVFPVPNQSLSVNPNLKQNDGY